MAKSVKKQQKEILAGYLSELKGMSVTKATDILEMIDQAKQLKDFAFREILGGNTEIMRFFKDYGEFILDCYEALPPESVSQDDKTNIEQAFDVLGIIYHQEAPLNGDKKDL